MTIYATPFRASDKQTTGPSVDSGFESINQVVETMGSDFIKRFPSLVIYGPGEDRIVFSYLIFRIDAEATP